MISILKTIPFSLISHNFMHSYCNFPSFSIFGGYYYTFCQNTYHLVWCEAGLKVVDIYSFYYLLDVCKRQRSKRNTYFFT